MSIHYENYSRFSRGQGFIGALCRPVSAQAKSPRMAAVDCGLCRDTLIGRMAVSRVGHVGRILGATWGGALIDGQVFMVPWSKFDADWAPLNLAEVFTS